LKFNKCDWWLDFKEVVF